MVLRVDQRNEKIVAGLFLRVCLEVDMSQSLKYELKYYRTDKIKSAKIDYEGVLECCFRCGLADHKFNDCFKMEKRIGIKIETKNTNFKDVDGENKRLLEKNPPLRELETWIEVQPKKRTKPLGSRLV